MKFYSLALLSIVVVFATPVLLLGQRGGRGGLGTTPKTQIQTEKSATPVVLSAPQSLRAQVTEPKLASFDERKVNMQQISLAIQAYRNATGNYPRAINKNTNGIEHSWHIAILPFLGNVELFNEYRLNEPWNSKNNLEVQQKMPSVYRHVLDDHKTCNTSYFAIVGDGTMWSEIDKSEKIPNSSRILFIEAKREIPWTKPEDLWTSLHPEGYLGRWSNGKDFLAAFANGDVEILAAKMTHDSFVQKCVSPFYLNSEKTAAVRRQQNAAFPGRDLSSQQNQPAISSLMSDLMSNSNNLNFESAGSSTFGSNSNVYRQMQQESLKRSQRYLRQAELEAQKYSQDKMRKYEQQRSSALEGNGRQVVATTVVVATT